MHSACYGFNLPLLCMLDTHFFLSGWAVSLLLCSVYHMYSPSSDVEVGRDMLKNHGGFESAAVGGTVHSIPKCIIVV